jgi:hypothetical protein
MRLLFSYLAFSTLLIVAPLCSAACLPIEEAKHHIGETRCVTGKVLKVSQGDKGVHFLDFCEDHNACPFTVVIFASDLRYVGDVRQLTGKTVEVHGPVKLYDNRAEIILSDLRQLKGEDTQIPPLPKNFDVERKGRYSAGKFSYPKSSRQTSRKRQSKPVPTTDPSETASPLD